MTEDGRWTLLEEEEEDKPQVSEFQWSRFRVNMKQTVWDQT
jgi:hypothetical protein